MAGTLLGTSATERLLIGLTKQLSRNDDHHISRELTDHLFASVGKPREKLHNLY